MEFCSPPGDVLLWELAAFSFLPAGVSPALAPSGQFLLLSRQLLALWGQGGHPVRGTCPLELGLLSLQSLWLGRGEEQGNMIHTWEQKITCICRCFRVYHVEKLLERRILILPEEKGGRKRHHLVMCAWMSCSNFSWENVYFLSLLVTQ